MTTAVNMDLALTHADIGRMLRELPVKDKSYQKTGPVGALAGRYIRWFRNEWGATPSSVRDYEAVIARMCFALGGKEPYEVSVEDLRAVIDLWADASGRTRQKVTSVVRAFWSWCEDEGHIAISPASKIRRPRAERRVVQTLPPNARPRLLLVAKAPRDRLGLFCLLALGVRRDELTRLQVRDFEPVNGWVRLYGKGRKERVLPVRGPMLQELRLFLSSDLPHVGRPPQGDDYLLYPVRRYANGWGKEGQMSWRWVAAPKDRPSPQVIHRWWYKHAQAAGLVGPGVTSGLNMHRARHTFAQELRRVAGIDAASQALGHSDLSTTLGTYGHQDGSDLEAAMEKYADWLDSSVPPNDPEEAQ